MSEEEVKTITCIKCGLTKHPYDFGRSKSKACKRDNTRKQVEDKEFPDDFRRVCTGCSLELPADAYYRVTTNKLGLNPRCKICVKKSVDAAPSRPRSKGERQKIPKSWPIPPKVNEDSVKAEDE